MRRGVAIAVLVAAFIAILNIPGTALPHAATSNSVLFDREIVRILDEHCVMCHVQGGPSFPLQTYEEVWLARARIHNAILEGHMPPWPAVAGYGDFANENGLTLRETRFVVSWVEGLGPRNDGEVFLNVLEPGAARRAETRAEIDFDTWRLGEPDAIASLTPAVPAAGPLAATPTATPAATPAVSPNAAPNAAPNVSAAGQDGVALRILRSTVDLGSSSDRWLQRFEYRPADRSSLHAVEFRLETNGQWLATWTPWQGTLSLPEGTAYRLPAGSKIVADLYVAAGTPTLERPGDIGLFFVDGPQPRAVTPIVLAATNATEHGDQLRLHAERRLDADTHVLALWPALPERAQSIELRARRPDGGIDILLLALDIPATWPTAYLLNEPKLLPAGTILEYTVYAASAGRDAGALRASLSASVY